MNKTPEIGSRVITDGRLASGGFFEKLIDCDDWDAAPFRLPSSVTGVALAVRVEVTGRKVRWDTPFREGAVRVKVTFVADGDEEDYIDGGWMIA